MGRRLLLSSHTLPLRRTQDEVQFGSCPDHGVVLAGLRDVEAEALLALRSAPTLVGWRARAARSGLPPERAARLLAVLEQHGMLRPGGPDRTGGPAEAATRGTRTLPGARTAAAPVDVCVLGSGPLPAVVREHLAAARSGTVLDRWPEGARRSPAALLLVVAEAVSAAEAAVWARSAVPHLPVIAGSHRVVVGPLVRPGLGPCLRCLDLHRTDRDAAWPRVLTQLAPDAAELAGEVRADPGLAGAAAGLAALLVRSHLRGDPVPVGSVWELALPWTEVTTRTWSGHPRCPYHQASVGRGYAGPDRLAPRGRGTE